MKENSVLSSAWFTHVSIFAPAPPPPSPTPLPLQAGQQCAAGWLPCSRHYIGQSRMGGRGGTQVGCVHECMEVACVHAWCAGLHQPLNIIQCLLPVCAIAELFVIMWTFSCLAVILQPVDFKHMKAPLPCLPPPSLTPQAVESCHSSHQRTHGCCHQRYTPTHQGTTHTRAGGVGGAACTDAM